MVIRKLIDGMLDLDAPDEVKDCIRPEARAPELDPMLGIRPEVTIEVNQRPGTPRHRLVTIGDSITHGFLNGAIFNTDIAYSMIIAWEMGWDESFRHPAPYGGLGGLPLNLEYLIRRLEQKLGQKTDWWELGAAAFEIRQFMDEVEDYWERGLGWKRGPGSTIPKEELRKKGINHNLAVYGWKLKDIITLNADICLNNIKQPTDNLLQQVVENANEHAALAVLNSARDPQGNAYSPVQAAAALGAEGTIEDGQGDGIETLIIMIGANNCLGSVVQFDVRWSCDNKNPNKPPTVWCPSQFKAELDEVVAQVKQIRARHVIWCTVPHVTIAPIARGVNKKVAPRSRYFPYYTYPWITDKDFDPKDDPNITENEARAIDSVIDQYNTYLVEAVKNARQEGKDWYVFELVGLLDRLAARRYIEDPEARPDWWTQYELPPDLKALSPVPDSRFFASNETGRTQGGLFSLDGIHPTTIGYGILAQELINIMQKAGVKFYLGDGKTERTGPVQVDFKRLIQLDTLIFDPPKSLASDLEWLGWLDRSLGIFKRLLRMGN